MEIIRVEAFDDNYIWLLRDSVDGAVAVVDPGDAAPVIAALEERGWTLTHILNTHHHGDHIGGNAELKRRYGAKQYGPRADLARIPGTDFPLDHGDTVKVGGAEATVFSTPGHTSGHIGYWFPEDKALFCGDTLFALGCGRLFEGTPEQMWASLGEFAELPDDALVYCAHEYTAANARFALTIETGNRALAERAAEITRLRESGRPTVPSRLGEERATNPFLRADVPAVKAAVGMPDAPDAAVFAEVRHRKDVFRG